MIGFLAVDVLDNRIEYTRGHRNLWGFPINVATMDGFSIRQRKWTMLNITNNATNIIRHKTTIINAQIRCFNATAYSF